MPPPLSAPPALVRSGLLRWLLDPRAPAPEEVRAILLGELVSTPGAIVMAALNGLIVSTVALCVQGHAVYMAFAGLEIGCCACRFAVIRIVSKAALAGRPRPIDLAVAMSILWCAMEGGLSFIAMRSDSSSLQTLSATMIMGVIGPICARNYPAPRLALLLICLCDLPFVAGGATSGQDWLLVMLPMTPPFLLGAWQIVVNLQRIALASLCAELDSRKRAYLDALTGLQNRRAFDEAIAAPLAALDGTFAILCLDLDGFKAVNDTLGHHAGDSLLIGVAHRLTESVRRSDSVFRLGGDEFVILLRGIATDTVSCLAERIIRHVAADPYHFDGLAPIRIGVSLGFACYPDDGTDPAELHRLADLALYASKAAGKGVQTRVSPPRQRQGAIQARQRAQALESVPLS